MSRLARVFGRYGLIAVITIALFEAVLQVVDLPYLRVNEWGSLQYRYDAELGWSPVPNSHSASALPRPIDVRHNSLGMRDVEFQKNEKPTILFMGDSLTWGYNVEARERFSDLLRARLPNHNVVNAGVSGFGTDQEYLLLRRLWRDVMPSVVVVMFCAENDHTDNSRNMRYFNYKPYLAAVPGGGWEFRGQPPPMPRTARFRAGWLTRHLMVARAAVSIYVELANPRITVPDATEPLLTMLRDYVQQQGARLLVGLQQEDPQLEMFLHKQKIPYARFDGVEYFDSSRHWTPDGHKLVAERLQTLFSAEGISATAPGAPGQAR